MKAWAMLVVGGLACLGCSPEAPRQPPAGSAPVVTSVPVTAAALDALVVYVPPEAVAVVAIDLEWARRSPVLSRVVELLVAQTGQATSITTGAGSLDVTSGVKVTGIGAFPDLTTAVRIAAAADLGKSFALGQLRSSDPVAARAIERVFARPVGSTLQITATFDDAEALGLLALLH